MTQFKDRRLLTTLLKESILQLCKISVGLVGNYEIDGIICISSSESDDQHIVVKVHEQILKDGLVSRSTPGQLSTVTQSERRVEREYAATRKSTWEHTDRHSCATNNHKRWMNSGQNERNNASVGGEASWLGQCRTSHIPRVRSTSPDKQHEHNIVASNGSVQSTHLHHSVYAENRTVFPESVPQDAGIGHYSYPILSDNRYLPLLTEHARHGFGRKRAGNNDIYVGRNKKRMQGVDIDFGKEVKLPAYNEGSQVCDNIEDFKHTLAAVGLSTTLDCGDVTIKKEVNTACDCEATASLSPSAVQVHADDMPVSSTSDYDVLSSQHVDFVLTSSSDLSQPVNTQEVHVSNPSSQDTEIGSRDGVVAVSPTQRDDSLSVPTINEYPCAQCKRCFLSRDELAEHFSECHTHATVHYCDRCQQGFTEEQDYTDHECSSGQECHGVTQISTSPGNTSHDSEESQLPVTDNAAPNSNNNKHTGSDVPVFTSDSVDSTNTATPEQSCGTAIHIDEPGTSAVTEADTKGLCDTGAQSFLESGCENDYAHQVEQQSVDTNSSGEHSGEFRCTVCQLLCYSYTALETHSLREHKRYTCPHCSKSFTQTSSRNRHMYTHGCRQPFSCLHCSARFTRAETLRKHYARQHHAIAMPTWLNINMAVRSDSTGTVDRGLSMDSVAMDSAWPAGSLPIDVNRDMIGYQAYLATRSSAEMIEISDEGE